MKNLAVLVALPFALVACGDGGSSSSGGAGITTPGASISSQFIDAPVKGLKYSIAGSTPGLTGDNGIFPCKVGEEITFEVKGRTIGKANCGEKIYIYDLDGSDDEKDAAAMLIQSLAKASGGVLDLTYFNDSSVSVDPNLPLSTATIETTLTTLISTNSLELAAVSKEDAQAHVAQNLPNQGDDQVLAAIANKEHVLNLKASASNPDDHCWEQVQVKVKFEGIDRGEAGGTAYRFNVAEYIAWDGNETAPTPTSEQCDGEEYSPDENNDEFYFQCLKNPVRKIMTGRSASGSQYKTKTFNIEAGAPAICQFDGGFEFHYVEDQSQGGIVCDDNDGEERFAASDLKLEFGLGWNFNVSLGNGSYTVNFTEQALDIGANLNADKEVTAYTQTKLNCSYSLTEEFDPGESLAE